MNTVQFANGKRFFVSEIDDTYSVNLRQQVKPALYLVFNEGDAQFDEIYGIVTSPDNTKEITVYYSEVPEKMQNSEISEISHKIYIGFTILKSFSDVEIETDKGSARKLTVALAQDNI